jgi:hypothetical protein
MLLAALLGLGLACAPSAGAYVYWTNGRFTDNPDEPQTIYRGNLDGTYDSADQCCPFYTSGLVYPERIDVDGGFIYWANRYDCFGPTWTCPYGSIGRANLDGTGGQFLISGLDGPSGVAVNSTHIYWTSSYVSEGSSHPGTTVGRANLDGTDVDESFITGASGPQGVAVDGAHVYWTNATGEIGRANLDGTDVDKSFVTGLPSNLEGLAVNSTHIYWTRTPAYVNGEIGRAPLADPNGPGKQLSFIATGQSPWDVEVNATHIYWTNNAIDEYGNGSIGRANLDGTGVDQDFFSSYGPFGLALDSGYSPPPSPPEFPVTCPLSLCHPPIDCDDLEDAVRKASKKVKEAKEKLKEADTRSEEEAAEAKLKKAKKKYKEAKKEYQECEAAQDANA